MSDNERSMALAKRLGAKVKKGSRVAYSRAFLKSMCAEATDPAWFARGIVWSVEPFTDFTAASVH